MAEVRAISLDEALSSRTKKQPSGRTLAAWGIACGLALATEYYAALIIVPEAAWLLYAHRRGPAVRQTRITFGVLALWVAPLLWLAISQNGTGHASWIAPLPFSPRVGQIAPQFLVGFQLPKLLSRSIGEFLCLLISLFGAVPDVSDSVGSVVEELPDARPAVPPHDPYKEQEVDRVENQREPASLDLLALCGEDPARPKYRRRN